MNNSNINPKTTVLPVRNSTNRSPLRRGFLLIPLTFALAWFALSPTAQAVTPAPDGGDPSFNTAEGEDALFSLTTGADNTAMGFDALYSNTTGSDNALASWVWRLTHRLNVRRAYHTATLLENGMVLVAGGQGGNSTPTALASAELYDPASETWIVTGRLNTARASHTATLLQNGMALVAGGFGTNSHILASAELYDPASGTWTATGRLNTERYLHTATLLQNGMVLVAGGVPRRFTVLASAELYDPASGTWTARGRLNTARRDHTATLLQNGMVLVAGGAENPPAERVDVAASAELYDPASGTWTATGNLNTGRVSHTATLLQNGMVLVAGGIDSSFNILASAELYDPASGTWAATGSLNTARLSHTATLLPDGVVLVAGGDDSNDDASASAELYDPASETWTPTGSLNTARDVHTATLLQNGTVLVAGGFDTTFLILKGAELGHRHR
jgi:hypothetical protein